MKILLKADDPLCSYNPEGVHTQPLASMDVESPSQGTCMNKVKFDKNLALGRHAHYVQPSMLCHMGALLYCPPVTNMY